MFVYISLIIIAMSLIAQPSNAQEENGSCTSDKPCEMGEKEVVADKPTSEKPAKEKNGSDRESGNSYEKVKDFVKKQAARKILKRLLGPKSIPPLRYLWPDKTAGEEQEMIPRDRSKPKEGDYHGKH